jgi:wobble nucleotide-excising tRNase
MKSDHMPGFVMSSFIMPALSAFSTVSELTRSPCPLLTCAKVTLSSLLMMNVDGYADLKRQVAALKSQIESGLADYKIESAVSAAATNAARIEAWKDQLNFTAPSAP